ncbi:unnamed protein product [Periconia digitata]|uniref:Uncharacterized protein n=1 Tax=Periconia digitata TaxID=1303443 RepID=A0A9W4UL13_9PLEO|nr:unnamed protein product [Periconia digitata]
MSRSIKQLTYYLASVSFGCFIYILDINIKHVPRLNASQTFLQANTRIPAVLPISKSLKRISSHQIQNTENMRSTSLLTATLALLAMTCHAFPAQELKGLTTSAAKCSTKADCTGGDVCMIVGCHGQFVGANCQAASVCNSFSAPTCGATCN